MRISVNRRKLTKIGGSKAIILPVNFTEEIEGEIIVEEYHNKIIIKKK